MEKCRCGPVLIPVLPTVAIFAPLFTLSPSSAKVSSMPETAGSSSEVSPASARFTESIPTITITSTADSAIVHLLDKSSLHKEEFPQTGLTRLQKPLSKLKFSSRLYLRFPLQLYPAEPGQSCGLLSLFFPAQKDYRYRLMGSCSHMIFANFSSASASL